MQLPIARPNQPVKAEDHNKLRTAIIALQGLTRRLTPRGSVDIGHHTSEGGTTSFIKKSTSPGSTAARPPWALQVSKSETGYKVKIAPQHTKIYTRFTHDEYKPIDGLTYEKQDPSDILGWIGDLEAGENWIYLTAQWTTSLQSTPEFFTIEVESLQQDLYRELLEPGTGTYFQSYSRTLIGCVTITPGAPGNPEKVEIDQRIISRLEAHPAYVGGAYAVVFS